MPKPSLYKNNSGTNQHIVERNKDIDIFLTSINPILNLIARQEFELAIYDVVI